jgi:tape measure domain-containing protein
MAMNVIGESGILIRPITKGFQPELQGFLDAVAERGGIELPLSIASTGVSSQIDNLKASAMKGVVLPLSLARDAADTGIAEIKTTAEEGADLMIRADSSSVDEALAQATTISETGVTVPINGEPSELDSLLSSIRQEAGAGVNLPIQAQLDAAYAEIGRLRASVEDASSPLLIDTSQSEASISSLGQGIDGIKQQMGELSAGLENTKRGAQGLLSGGLGGLLGGGAIVGALAGGAVLAAGQKRLSSIEDSTTALTVKLGSAAKSGQVVADTLKSVQGTPFTLDQFLEASRTLVTFGVEAKKIPSYLGAIGEAAAGSGRGIQAVSTITDVFSQVSIKGKVNLEDIWRLSGNGVDALTILGNAFGKTAGDMQEMISDGAVPSEKALDALISGISTGSDGVAGKVLGLGGSMEALRDTLSGASGGLGAAAARLGVAILEPFRPATVKIITNVTDALDKLGPAIKEMFTAISESGTINAFVNSLTKLPDLMEPFLVTMKSIATQAVVVGEMIIEGFKPVAEVVGGAALGAVVGLLEGLDSLLGVMSRNEQVTKALAAAFAALFVFNKIQNWITGVIGAITKTTAWAASQQAYALSVEKANIALARQTALQSAGSAFQALPAGVAGPVLPADLLTTTKDTVSQVSDTTAKITEATEAAKKLGPELEVAGEVGSKMGGKIAAGASAAGNGLLALVGGPVGASVLAIAAAGLAIKMIYDNMQKNAEEAANKITASFRNADFATDANRSLKSRVGAAQEFSAEIDKQRLALDQRAVSAENSANKDKGIATAAGYAILTFTPLGPIIAGVTAAAVLFGGDGAEAVATVSKAQQKLIEYSKENSKGFIELSKAVKVSGDALELLGVTAETNAQEITKNKLSIREMLDAAINPNLDDGKQAEARAKNERAARILAKYDLEQLSAALDAAGISMSDLADMSTNDMVEALEKAAAATGKALAQATGLSKELANLAVAYDNAHKAAKTFTETLFTGNNEWLAGLAGADAYRSSLDALIYTTDFTAANLGKVADSFQSVIEQTYADSLANSVVTDATQKTADAMAAAAAKSNELREQFINQALAANKSREEAESLANALFGIPQSLQVNIDILVNTQQLDAAQAKLDRLIDAQTNVGNPFAIIQGAVAVGNAQGEVNAAAGVLADSNQLAAFYAAVAEQERQKQVIATQRQQQAAEEARKAAEEARRKQEETERENARALQAYFRAVNAENERALKEAEAANKKAEVEAARLAKELADAQDKAEQERQRIIEGIQSASDSLTNSLEGFIKSFQNERKTLIGDIRKKVEFEQATSVTSLIRNADKRNAALTEASAGLIALRQRGLSSDAITAMGLTGRAEDAKAIRRLLSATPAELAKLSSSVGKLGATATQAAYKEQGEIIGREVRDVLRTWLATPGVVATTLDVTAISNLIVGATGNTEASAINISTQLGATKR